jgi:hypothetical protein
MSVVEHVVEIGVVEERLTELFDWSRKVCMLEEKSDHEGRE